MLAPLRCYIGNESWDGYVVFEFRDSNSVVLECPFEGNATYILPADWKIMAGHKPWMRMRYRRKLFLRLSGACGSGGMAAGPPSYSLPARA